MNGTRELANHGDRAHARRVNLQREANLARPAALYLQGKGQVETGLDLRVSQPQVSRDLARIAHLGRVYWESRALRAELWNIG